MHLSGLAAAATAFVAGTASALPTYDVVNLGASLPGNVSSFAYGVSSTGSVAGFYQNSNFTVASGFLYDDGAVTSIPLNRGTPRAVNSSNVVALSGGAIYTPGTGVTVIPTSPGGSSISGARDINDAGLVVGSQRVPVSTFTTTHPIVYNSVTNTTTDLGNTALGGSPSSPSDAYGVNALGQVVGVMDAAGDPFNYGAAFLATPTVDGYAFTNVGAAVLDDIAGAVRSVGYDVNDLGTVVGTYANQDGLTLAFLYENGVASDLGDLGSTTFSNSTIADAINNDGIVVGTSATADNAARAFVYEDGLMVDLNTLLPTGSGITLTRAYDINDAGQIAATGTLNGMTTAFLLNPVAVPEPSSLLGLIGAGLLTLRRSRRRVALA